MNNSILITIEPSEVVIDKETGKAEFFIRNETGKDYAFKIKTTHPASYEVVPRVGMLSRGKSIMVEVRPAEKIDPSTIHEHRFLLQFVESTHNLSNEDIKQVLSLKSVRKIEKNLTVRYSGIHVPAPRKNMIENSDAHLLTFIAVLFIGYCSIILIRKIVFGF